VYTEHQFKTCVSRKILCILNINLKPLYKQKSCVNEKKMMFGFNIGGKLEILFNTLIIISKWSIWKARNKVKYDKININENVLCKNINLKPVYQEKSCVY
jgi:hypothetical protein